MDEDTDAIDWGRIATDSLTTGLILAGGHRTVSGWDQLGDAAWVTAERKATALNFEAEQLLERAGQARAVSQRAAWEERRRGRLAQSRLVALVAAQGGSATDVIDLSARISTEAAYRASVATYEGLDRARTFRLESAGKRYEAGLALEEGRLQQSAYSALASAAKVDTATTLAQKYAPEIVRAVSGAAGELVDAVWPDSGSEAQVSGDAMSQGNDLGFFNWDS